MFTYRRKAVVASPGAARLYRAGQQSSGRDCAGSGERTRYAHVRRFRVLGLQQDDPQVAIIERVHGSSTRPTPTKLRYAERIRGESRADG
jgi:hypothetical protein